MRMLLQFIPLMVLKSQVISALETTSSWLFRWFNNNFMKVNSDKSHFAMSYKEPSKVMFDGLSIASNKLKVFLGKTIDHF